MRRVAVESLTAAEPQYSILLDLYNGGADLPGIINLGELRSSPSWLEKNEREEADVIRCRLARVLAPYAPDSLTRAKEIAGRVAGEVRLRRGSVGLASDAPNPHQRFFSRAGPYGIVSPATRQRSRPATNGLHGT